MSLPQAKKAKILIVDYEATNLQILNSLLSENGHDVQQVLSGQQALYSAKELSPDLILLDVNLLDIDGYEVCRQFKMDENTRSIPIILIGALQDTQDKAKGFKLGAVDYITKPFQPEEVIARISTQLRVRELTDHLENKIEEGVEKQLVTGSQQENGIKKHSTTEEALRRSEALLNATQRLSKVGGWEYDVNTKHFFWSEEVYRIHEIPIDPDINHIEKSLLCYLPDDRQVIADAFFRATEEGEAYDLEFPFITYKGKHLWIRTAAQPVYENGNIVRVVGNIMDITERKRAQEASLAFEQRFRAIFDNSNDGILLADIKTRKFILGNGKICELLGYTPDEILKLGLTDIHAEQDMALVNDQFEKLARQEIIGVPNLRVIRKDSSVFYADISAAPVTLDNETYLIGIFRDVTDRLRAEEEIKKSEELYRNLAETTSDLICIHNKESIISINKPGAKLLGAESEDEIIGKSALDFVAPDYKEAVVKRMQGLFQSRKGQPDPPDEEQFVKLDGSVIDVEVSGFPFIQNNEPAMLVVAKDITDRKRTERALRENEEAFRHQFANISDVIFSLDANGIFLNVSPSIETYLGYKPEELIGRSFADLNLIQPQYLEKAIEDMKKIFNGERVEKAEYEFIAKDGSSRFGEISGSPIIIDGQVVATASVARDITEIVRSRDWREQMNNLKEDLLRPGNIHEKLKRITDGLVFIFDADFARIWIIKPGDLCDSDCMHAAITEGPHVCRHRDRCLHLMASSGRYTHIDGEGHRRVPFGCYKIGRVAAGDDPKFITNEVTKDPRVHNHDWAKELGLASFAGYRLLSMDQQPAGVLALFSKHEISPEMDSLLMTMAGSAALVIHSSIAEEALKESEERFKQVAEHTQEWIWEVDADGLYTFASPVVESILGYKPEEIVGQKHFYDFFESESLERLKSAAFEVFKKKQPFSNFENWNLNKRGERIFFITSGIPILDEMGNLRGYRGVDADISERQRAKERLTKLNQTFVNLTPDVDKNINLLTGTCGEILGACCALYNRLEDGVMCSVGQWQSPEDYIPIDTLQGNICFDVIQKGKDGGICIIDELQASHYAKTDPTIKRYALKTYIGHPTTCFEQNVGSLCAIFKDDVTFDENDKKIMGILATAISIEEERKKSNEELEKLSTAMKISTDGVVITDINGVIKEVNDAILKIYGTDKREDLIGINTFDLMEGESFSKASVGMRDVLEKGSIKQWEFSIATKNNSTLPVEMSVSLMKDNQGNPSGFAGIIRDISERKRTEQALLESEEKYRKHFTNVTDVIYSIDANGVILNVSPSVERLLGYQPEELIGKYFTELNVMTPDSLQAALPDIQKVFAGQRIDSAEYEFIRKDGSIRFGEVSGSPIIVDGQVVATSSVARDITERKHAEEQRRTHLHFLECLEQIDKVIRQADDLEQTLGDVIDKVFSIFNCDRAWLLYPCDPDAPSFCVPVETARPEYPGALDLDLEIPMTSEIAGDCREALNSEGPITFGPGNDKPIFMDTHKFFQVQSQMFMSIRPMIGLPWMFGMHQCTHPRIWTQEDQRLFNEIGRRITDSLSSFLSARNLMESEEKFRTIGASALDAVIMINGEGKVEYWNPAAESMFGYSSSEILGKDVHDLIMPEQNRDQYAKGFENFKTTGQGMAVGKVVELSAKHKDGSEFHIEIAISSIPVKGEFWATAIIRNVEDRKQAEEEKENLESQLRQSQKMEAIGRLTGGVAHDFNNIMTGIIGYSTLLMSDFSSNDPAYSDMAQIKKAAEKASSLTSQLLAFSRKQIINPKILDLNALLADSSSMLKRLVGEDIEYVLLPGKDIDRIKVDPGQMEQVLVNLVVNARDAMPEGGKLIVETVNATIDEDYRKLNSEAIPGEFVMMIVSDTGSGMDAETLKYLFEPFYTTKEKGKGTGLGLSMVYGIVKQCGGFINVQSEVRIGTTFKIYLPLVREEPEIISESDKPIISPAGTETILLVEDEELVRNLTEKILESHGYKVFTADRGNNARMFSQDHDGNIDLLLTDVVMPGMNGRILYENIQTHRPEIKVLYMSGYTDDMIAHHGVLNKDTHFLQKPFTIEGLLEKVREALERA